MSSNGSGSLSNNSMGMGPFSAEIGGSILWFNGWMPTTGPATFFAFVGLSFLAAFSRFLEAFRLACIPPTELDPRRRTSSPFGPECVCATLFMVWSAISYFLMLAVMQYNVWFFIAILIGLGVGELGFGRYCRSLGASRTVLTSQASGGHSSADEKEAIVL
ncbi:hypothetical protein EI94DRAFT_1794819 [Lactarius quietus]|nr:hypothetical protein EI94DRAFT_1794819 [Lactarius quietus]